MKTLLTFSLPRRPSSLAYTVILGLLVQRRSNRAFNACASQQAPGGIGVKSICCIMCFASAAVLQRPSPSEEEAYGCS